jgi:hypothetical protein
MKSLLIILLAVLILFLYNKKETYSNYMSSNFKSDNLDISNFFSFDTNVAKYYSKTNRIVNNYLSTPITI